jgi:hypothetical protein
VRHTGLAASALATLPIFWLASTVFSPGAGVAASFLWIFSPPVFSRLLLALHATVVGSFLDTLAIAAVLALSFEPSSRARFAAAFGAAFASLLAYTSSLFSMGAFFLFESLLERKLALRLLAGITLGSILTVTWLYGPFLASFFGEILPALASGAAGPASGADSSPVGTALSRIPLFYGFLYPPLAIAGLVIARRTRDPRAFRVLAAWGLAFLLMVGLRAFGGGVFKDLKEIELAAPLVAILTGATLHELARRGRMGTLFAVLLAAALALFGLARYRVYLELYRSPVVSTAEVRP